MTGQADRRTRMSRRSFLKTAGAGLAAGVAGFPAIVRAGSKTRSVIVLGIDGMDPALLHRFMSRGMMPNARRLIELGGFSRLGTSTPPQSPVAWSNFISGTNAGGHGIYDFIARDPSTMKPYLSTSHVEGSDKAMNLAGLRVPLGKGETRNLRGGPTFWKTLEEHGIDSTAIRMPANFPPAQSPAKTLSGLGTPDIHGSYGIFSYYTGETGQRTRQVPGGRIIRVIMQGNAADCELRGPVNSFDPERRETGVPFKVYTDPVNPTAMVSIQDRRFILREGEWSDWIRIRFPLVPHIAEVPGICRFFLKKAGEKFALYVSPVNIDPRDPYLPVSTPGDYSRRLAGRIGDFYTQGMPVDTSALSAGVLEDSQYRQQAGLVLNEEMRMYESELNRFNSGFFFFYFCSLDLNSHTFWRTLDRQHPLYSSNLAEAQGGFLPMLYRRMDAAIGRALKRIDDRTLLFVVSDHGFGSFRRQFNLNTWLMENGYTSSEGYSPYSRKEFFADVNWSRTKAYGLGINGLYLNMKGREHEGTVPPGSAAHELKRELAARLKDVRDPKTGQKVISNVYDRNEVYSGPHVKKAPDLIIGYNINYRASWDTVLGKYTPGVLRDNTDPWSGDHATDPAHMSGVFLANRPVAAHNPALSDMAPTILREYGVPLPEGMTGRYVF